MNIQRLLVMTMALLCSACAAPRAEIDLLSSDFESFLVVLVPNLETKVLDITTPAQGFESNGKKNGWVGFERGKYGTVTFTLNQLPSRQVCTSDSATSAEWVISRIQLSQNGNPQDQKGLNFGNPQTGWIERAFPQMEPTDGEIDDPRIGTISVEIQDLNNHRGKQTAYYQITAKRCSDGLELMTDPGIRNGGR